MSDFKDHFSGHASIYSQARPHYPESIFEWLSGLTEHRELAWDVGTGNGQAAIGLASHFTKVIATDASETQIAAAPECDGVEFRVAPAEEPPEIVHDVDLVTSAQAAHWFDRPAFYAAVRKVARPGAVIALWCYERCRINAELDEMVGDYYRSLDSFWPPERALVEEGYRGIEFPFEEFEAPLFEMSCRWRSEEMLAYLESWSATQRCAKDTGRDPLMELRNSFGKSWGVSVRDGVWPISMRVGRLRV